MASPRTRRRPFAIPREIRDAPLEAHRSHLYPVAPPVAAYERMAAGELAYEQWLPQNMGQQQWKKDADYGYGPQMGPVEGFIRAVSESGSDLRTARLHQTPHPQLPWEVVAQQLVDQADWALPTDPTGRHPIMRGLPYPRPWPAETFDEMAAYEDWTEARWVEQRRQNRARSMERIRALEAEWAPFTYDDEGF